MDEFLTTLAEDAAEAARRCRDQDTPVHRREFIRSIFAAAEGFAWHLKRDVFAHTAAGLSAHETAALSEETYAVDERGKLSVQARFLPLVQSIRLAIRIVQRYRPSYVVDFNDKGWHGLVSSVEVRNRLVHPKTIADLSVTDQEIERATSGLDWLKKAQASIAEAMRNEHFKSADLLKHLLDGLSKSIPELETSRPKFELEIESMQVDVVERERHLELIRDVLSAKQRAFEALRNKLVEIFPDLETAESDSVDANQVFNAFIKGTEEPDKTGPMWELLQKFSPGVKSDEAKVERAQKAMETFVAEREKQNERVREHWLERQKRRSEIEARLSALDPPS